MLQLLLLLQSFLKFAIVSVSVFVFVISHSSCELRKESIITIGSIQRRIIRACHCMRRLLRLWSWVRLQAVTYAQIVLSCSAAPRGLVGGRWELALAGAAAPRGAKRICLLVFGFVACCAGCFSSLAGAAAPKKCEAYLPSGCWVGCWFVALGV